MSHRKILYITTEMFPYQEDTKIAESVNKMALKMHQEGNDVRVFMPRFGLISERKFQLHEVIRLSGMNIIINDLDQPLIVKVASLPGERLQVYFIDNEEYFKRKQYYLDEDGTPFEDNDERAIFYARGVVETIKKLNWVPDVIHINGWMATFVAIYLKNFYKTDAYFQDVKLVLSIYNEADFEFSEKIGEKLGFDGIKNLKVLDHPTVNGFLKESIDLVDLVVKGDTELGDVFDFALENASARVVDMPDDDSIADLYKD